MDACANCGRTIGKLEQAKVVLNQVVCAQCEPHVRAAAAPPGNYSISPHAAVSTRPVQSKRIAAGVCALLVGGIGIHKFVLGYTLEGVVYIIIWLSGFLLCVPWLIVPIMSLIEGIIYLSKSDEEFIETYQINKRPWF